MRRDKTPLKRTVRQYLIFLLSISVSLVALSTPAAFADNPPCYTVVSGVLTDGTACSGDLVIDSSVTSIGDGAFQAVTALTSVVIPTTVTSIGLRAFENDTSLTSALIPSSVVSIGAWAFSGDKALTSISIPNGVSIISPETFAGDTALASVTLPNSVTSIGYGAFSNDTSLGSINIPNSVTSIGTGAFTGDTALISVIIPNSVVGTFGDAFSGETSVTSIVISDGITSIDPGAFNGDSALTSIAIPNGVTSIGSTAFINNTSLTSLVIPDSVTSIGSNAFGYTNNGLDTALSSVTYCGSNSVVLTYPYPNGVTPSCPGGDTVTFDSNGGTGNMASETSTVAAAITTNTFLRTDYTFTGWNTTPNGSGLAFGDGATFNFTGGDITLYAQWAINTYPYFISFDPDAGSGTMPDENGNDSTVTLNSNLFVPPAGEHFTGWLGDNSILYGDGQTIPITAYLSLGLTAQYAANPHTYSISFDPGRGSGSMGGQTGNDSSVLLSPNSFIAPTGEQFNGWLGSDAVSYTDGQRIPLGADLTLTLTAEWTPVFSGPTVTFDANGGSGTMAPETGTSTQPLTSNTFTNGSLYFSGWNTAPDGSGLNFANNDNYSFNVSITLYAQWIVPIIFTFDANGGTGTMPAEMGQGYTQLNANTFTNPGKIFLYWSNTPDGQGPISYVDHTQYANFNQSLALYAQWASTLPVVTFDPNGGSGSMDPQTLGSPGALNTNTFTRDGFTFDGWTSNADGSGTFYTDNGYLATNSDLTLYALWSQIFTVTFNNNGATSGTVPDPVSYNDGDTVTIDASNTGVLAHAGQTFFGWSGMNNGTPVFIGDPSLYGTGAPKSFVIHGNITLYAQFVYDNYLLFDNNGGTGMFCSTT